MCFVVAVHVESMPSSKRMNVKKKWKLQQQKVNVIFKTFQGIRMDQK